MKTPLILLILISAIACQELTGNGSSDTSSVESKIDSILAEMTLIEKIGQMNQYSIGTEMTGPNAAIDHSERYKRLVQGEVGSVLNLLGAAETRKLQQLVMDSTRLSIPLIFAYDVIHGYRTMFPIPLAEAASWDLDAIELSARVAAIEASAAGVQWTFAPMIDVSRDARWGRVMEGAGEDPFLGSEIAKARVKGFQGDDLSDISTIAACAKHFAGYGFIESGKDYNSVSVGRNTLHNYILPPFKAALESDVATFMNAFNDIDGTPSTASTYLLRDLLEQKWGYDGVVVSDWNSIGEQVDHGTATDLKDAARQAALAGSDIDMEGEAYVKHLQELVEEGLVPIKYIDEAVAEILRLKFRLGLFDDPFKYIDVDREAKLLGNADQKKASKEVAAKSIVLLKNENKLLPLAEKSKIGLIGPLVKDKDTPLGNWRANAVAHSAVSLYEGMEAEFGANNLLYSEGCKLSIGPNNFFEEVVIEQNDRSGFAEARKIARQSDVVVMALGEPAFMSGEARSRSEINLPGLQLELLKEVYKVNTNIILVLMNGRPLTIPWEYENVPAIIEAWHLGSEAGNAIAEVIAGKINPSGKLPMSFPRHVGQLPIYYNHLNTGRPASDAVFYAHHMDVDKSPLIPFGYGLSYSTFEYGELKFETNGDGINASVDVTNTSDIEGSEVVQLYIRDLVASIARPVKELKGFQKVSIAAGQSVTVSFSLSKEDLSFYNTEGDLVFESGEYLISVGGNSQDLKSAKIGI